MNLYKKETEFKSTTQSAIKANSEQAMQLQSRKIGTGGNALQMAAKNAADAAKKTEEEIKELNNIQKSTKEAIDKIYQHLSEIGVSMA